MTTKTPDKLVRGSIRVFKDACFYEERDVQQVNISYGDMSTVLHITSVPNGLKEIFAAAKISFEPDCHTACRINTELEGIQLDGIEPADEDHLRIKFSGLTEAALAEKLTKATHWLKDHDVPFGETDGKAACIFKCMTSEQLELGEL
jgi:hypothetical protein